MRGGRERGIGSRQRVLMRREQHREPRRDCEDERRQQELQAARVERDGGREPDGSGDPRAAAEREVERREEHRQRRGGAGARDKALPPGREAEREERAHRGEQARRVPVGQRLLETIVPPPGRTHRGAPGKASSGGRSRRRAKIAASVPASTIGAPSLRSTSRRPANTETYMRTRRPSRTVAAGSLLHTSASHVQAPKPPRAPREISPRPLGRVATPRPRTAATKTSASSAAHVQAVGK